MSTTATAPITELVDELRDAAAELWSGAQRVVFELVGGRVRIVGGYRVIDGDEPLVYPAAVRDPETDPSGLVGEIEALGREIHETTDSEPGITHQGKRFAVQL